MRVLGIDPGTLVAGWGVLETEGGEARRLGSGTLALGRSSTPIAERLYAFRKEVVVLLKDWEPDFLALESAFFGRNARTALRLGEARGCVMATAAEMGVEVREIPPAQVKRRVAGAGNATKDQVARLVGLQLGIEGLEGGDEGDALAVALCYILEAEGVLGECGAGGGSGDILPPGASPA